jgi:hypothetical protein
MGTDSIPSADLKRVWLLEVQGVPGLKMDTPAKKAVMTETLTEMLKINAEIMVRKAQGASLKHLDSMKTWQWVINEATH